MIIPIPISKESYTKAILSTVNTFFSLSPKELDILTAMIENNIHELTTSNRERLRGILNIDQVNLNSYIYKLKNKGNSLVIMNNILSINPYILRVIDDKSITFNFETH